MKKDLDGAYRAIDIDDKKTIVYFDTAVSFWIGIFIFHDGL